MFLQGSRLQADDSIVLLGLCVMIFAFILFSLAHVAFSTVVRPLAFKDALPVRHRGAVTSGNVVCSRIGIQILARGGNAADAAVATQFCLGVISPDLTGLGGGGFALIRAANGSYTHVDFRETAPAASSQNMYSSNHSDLGTGAFVGVPGEVRGLQYIYDHFCSLPWIQLVRPAVDLAYNGFPLYQDLDDQITFLDSPEFLSEDPSWAQDFAPGGHLLTLNQTLRRHRYGKTLKILSEKGPDAFYTGQIAQNTVDAVRQAGGLLTLEDLENYKVVVRAPIEIQYRGYRILSSGAPSGGPVVLSALKVVEGYPDLGKDRHINLTTHRLDEAIRFAYGERTLLGDPSFVKGVDKYVHKMIDKQTAAKKRDKISDFHTLPVEAYNPDGIESLLTPGTSHLETADNDGMVVCLTSTINNAFGSRLMVPETGIILNNELLDFSTPNSSAASGLKPSPNNLIEAGKRPLSSISPVIVEAPGQKSFLIALGGAGGSKIITSVIQVLWRILDQGMNLTAAVAAPRFHDQLNPNTIFFELEYDNRTVADMASRGHHVDWLGWRQSNVHGIKRASDNSFQAVSDPFLVNSGSFVL